MDVYLATEDDLSEAVGKKLIEEMVGNNGYIVSIQRKGKNYLRTKIAPLLRTSINLPVLLIADLDNDECPPALIREWVGRMTLTDNFMFRVSVREIESWLLADAESFSNYSGVPFHRIPARPELLVDPKAELLNIVRRHGGVDVKADLLPKRGSGASKGIGYNNSLIRYVNDYWSAPQASVRSESLMRAMNAIERTLVISE